MVNLSGNDSLAAMLESKMAFEEVALLGVLKAEMKALQADVQLVFEMANKTAGLWEIY